MSCRAEIYTQSKSKTIAVPSELIIFASQGKNAQEDDESDNEVLADNVDHVFVLIDGKAVKQTVELGISNDRLQEITSGLKVGDKVITGPARALGKLKDAQSVKVIDKEA
jgi:HlyD family secretion protein